MNEPFYQTGVAKEVIDKSYKPGDYVINCADESTTVSSIKEPGSIKISDDDCIVLLNDNLKEVMQLPLPKKERKALFRAVREYLKPYKSDEKQLKQAKDRFRTSKKVINPQLIELIRAEASKMGI